MTEDRYSPKGGRGNKKDARLLTMRLANDVIEILDAGAEKRGSNRTNEIERIVRASTEKGKRRIIKTVEIK